MRSNFNHIFFENNYFHRVHSVHHQKSSKWSSRIMRRSNSSVIEMHNRTKRQTWTQGLILPMLVHRSASKGLAAVSREGETLKTTRIENSFNAHAAAMFFLPQKLRYRRFGQNLYSARLKIYGCWLLSAVKRRQQGTHCL